jgi:serine/threonine protein kinase
MASVYLAHDIKHGRAVAVKVLDWEIANSLGSDRFLREIRITASLQHPNILTLIDSGEAAGFLYFVMPFAEGETLRQRLEREACALPLAEAVRILRDMLDALAYAHAHGLIHRDVKPENVMLTGRHAVMLDFGVAKALQGVRQPSDGPDASDAEPLTSVGTSLGTPAYMAPEQAAADPDVDLRADLYSVGFVAYEMLTGSVPFHGTAFEILSAQACTMPTPIEQAAPTLPKPLAMLITQLLQKDPDLRPASAELVLAELEDALTVS